MKRMMSRLMVGAGVGLLVAWIAGCATAGTVAEPYQYTGEKLMYPAVHYMIEHDDSMYFRDAVVTYADFLESRFVIEGVRAYNLTTPSIATLTITHQEGVINLEFSDFNVYRDGQWQSQSTAGFFPTNSIHNIANTYFEMILEDEAQYQQALQGVHSDAFFLGVALGPMTELQRNYYIEDFLGDAVSEFTAQISQVRENDRFGDEEFAQADYEYSVTLRIERAIEFTSLNRYVTIFYYTSDPVAATRSRGTTLTFSGVLRDIKPGSGVSNLAVLTVFDQN